MATGQRINRAADDAAGLAISSALRADIRAMQQGVRNANDGISVVQVTEGALEEVNTILTRMKELAEAGGLRHLRAGQRHGEVRPPSRGGRAASSEIDRIRDSTEFLGRDVLQDVSLDVQIGITADVGESRSTSTRAAMPVSTSRPRTWASQRRGHFHEVRSAVSTDGSVDGAIDDVVRALRGDLGALQNRLESAVRNQQNVVENMVSADSRIRDADMAQEIVNLSKGQILQQTGMAALSQANQQAQSVLSLLR